MRRTAALLAMLLWSPAARADDPDEPMPRGSQPVPSASRPVPSASQPVPTASQPTPTGALTPTPAANTPAPPIDPNALRPSRYALGARVRGLFVTPAMMAPFLTASTALTSASLGIEFIYRKPTYDVVTSLDFSFVTPDDGNYLGANHDASSDTHFVHFDNLNFISADVSIIGHHWFTDWFELRYGAGIGLGVVLGNVFLINDSSSCTTANASDITQCHPLGVDLTSPQRQQQLQATASSGTDTNTTPHYHNSADKPPVIPVVNILMGALFKVHRRVTVQVELGFRDAIFFGAGAHYWF